MKIISLFNNKGGVGKSTLSYHLGCGVKILCYLVYSIFINHAHALVLLLPILLFFSLMLSFLRFLLSIARLCIV